MENQEKCFDGQKKLSQHLYSAEVAFDQIKFDEGLGKGIAKIKVLIGSQIWSQLLDKDSSESLFNQIVDEATGKMSIHANVYIFTEPEMAEYEESICKRAQLHVN